MLADSSTYLIIATSTHCSFNTCRSQLSKAANLLLKCAFSSFCFSEFVYDTVNVYFR